MKRADDPFILSPPAGVDGASVPLGEPSPDLARSCAAVKRLVGFDPHGNPLVGFNGEAAAPARSIVPLRPEMIGREVVTLLDATGGEIVIGHIEPLLSSSAVPPQAQPDVIVEADGERHTVTAQQEIVLRCGDASITLTRAGKVIIRGTYISSRSSGLHRIKGAAIDIN